MIAKFLASKWVTVLLLVTLVAGGWYVYQQGRQLGELQGAKDELEARQADRDRESAGIIEQNKILRDIRDRNAKRNQEILEALDETSAEFRRCFDMPVPGGMRIDDGYEDSR